MLRQQSDALARRRDSATSGSGTIVPDLSGRARGTRAARRVTWRIDILRVPPMPKIVVKFASLRSASSGPLQSHRDRAFRSREDRNCERTDHQRLGPAWNRRQLASRPKSPFAMPAPWPAELPAGQHRHHARRPRDAVRCWRRRFATGLTAVGRTVIDADVAATPTTGVLVRQFHAAGGIQISASHNPAEYNGLKLFSAEGRVIPEAAGAKVIDRYRQTARLGRCPRSPGNCRSRAPIPSASTGR